MTMSTIVPAGAAGLVALGVTAAVAVWSVWQARRLGLRRTIWIVLGAHLATLGVAAGAIALAQSAGTAATPPTGPIGPALSQGLALCGASDGGATCCLCGLFAALERISVPYTQNVYMALANAVMKRILPDIVIITFGLVLLKLFLEPGKAMEHAIKFASHFAIVIFVVSVMTAGNAAGGNLWIYDWVFMSLQQAGILAAEQAIQMGASAASSVVGSGPVMPTSFTMLGGGQIGQGTFTHLWAQVELVALPIIKITAKTMDSWWSVLSFQWLPYLILAVPYVFVLGIFGAFMVQTMFYFIAMSAAAPLFLTLFLFEKTRTYMFAALKFLVGGSLTILFAGVAMGFTGFILFSYLGQLAKDTSAGGTMFGWLFWKGVSAVTLGGLGSWSGSTDASFAMSSAAYWMIFLLGFISALLHLAAPRIASNISGSQDTATSAAFVTAAGQFLGAKAIGWMYKGGRGLVGTGAGLAGAGASGLMNRFRRSQEG
jgi:hypothetical protein